MRQAAISPRVGPGNRHQKLKQMAAKTPMNVQGSSLANATGASTTSGHALRTSSTPPFAPSDRFLVTGPRPDCDAASREPSTLSTTGCRLLRGGAALAACRGRPSTRPRARDAEGGGLTASGPYNPRAAFPWARGPSPRCDCPRPASHPSPRTRRRTSSGSAIRGYCGQRSASRPEKAGAHTGKPGAASSAGRRQTAGRSGAGRAKRQPKAGEGTRDPAPLRARNP